VRYGGEAAMAEVERIFRADSEAVVRLLAVYTGDAGLDARWRLCLKGIDMLLDDLGFDLAGRASIVAAAREALGRELHPGAALKERLAARLRREKRFLEALFDSARLPDDLRRGVAVLEARSPEVREAATCLRALAHEGELTRPLDEIAGSLVHMFANRLLRSAQRMQELVLYDFLDRTYRSRRARPAATGATSA
jgi:thiopeptide-type bacteriocin biosynthesis protein